MPLVVGVAFKPVTKIYYFDPAGVEGLIPGERVIVDTSRGRTLGRVVFAPREIPEAELSGPLKPVVRLANAWDMVQQDQVDHHEDETLALCRQRSVTLNLPMKVIEVEYAFDSSSLVVYFTSEQRIDFRNLVHDLAQALHTRVEMRQVGVRDEAKFLGGFGKCGRELCCASWLRDFAPVSIKMAKTQDLPLNSSEVSGVCGRLLCCLGYENDFYIEARKQMPRLNSIIDTPQGPGKVRQVHVLRNAVTAVVDGPNETTIYVDVVLPEPAAPSAGPCPGCPARRTPLATSDEPDGLGEPGDEELPAAVTPAPARREAAPRPEPAAAPGKAAPSKPPAEVVTEPNRKSRARRRRH